MRDAVTGTNAEKRQVAAAGEGLKVAAGMGDAVDLVKRVWEVGHARRSLGHGAESERRPVEGAVVSLAFELAQDESELLRIAPGKTQAARDGRLAEHLHEGQAPAHHCRR